MHSPFFYVMVINSDPNKSLCIDLCYTFEVYFLLGSSKIYLKLRERYNYRMGGESNVGFVMSSFYIFLEGDSRVHNLLLIINICFSDISLNRRS
jgi:hypothetical protein